MSFLVNNLKHANLKDSQLLEIQNCKIIEAVINGSKWCFINGSKWCVWIDYAPFNTGWLIHVVDYLAALYENVLSNCSNYALWDPHLCLHENLV